MRSVCDTKMPRARMVCTVQQPVGSANWHAECCTFGYAIELPGRESSMLNVPRWSTTSALAVKQRSNQLSWGGGTKREGQKHPRVCKTPDMPDRGLAQPDEHGAGSDGARGTQGGRGPGNRINVGRLCRGEGTGGAGERGKREARSSAGRKRRAAANAP